MRGRPPTLLTLLARSLRREPPPGAPALRRLLVATSGGPDSQALLHGLAHLAARFSLTLVAHGVDHGLRPEASSELDGAEALARRVGVPFGRTRVDVAPGGNLQARARAARLAALAAAAHAAGADAIALAHTMDDRAETVLLRLLRGAGARGLAAMGRDVRVGGARLVRPLLDARREQVRAHLARHDVPYADDPSNRDARHTRVRVRHEVLPLLTTLDPRVVEHLAHLADDLAGRRGPPAELGRATAEALGRLGTLTHPDAEVWLPGGLVVRRGGAQVRPVRAAPARGTKQDADVGSPRAPRPRKPGRAPRAR